MKRYFKMGNRVRRILKNGMLQEWSHKWICWLGMRRVGDQWVGPDATAAGWEAEGWKEISEAEALSINQKGK